MTPRTSSGSPSASSRLLWFVVLYAGGIASVGVVACGLRLWLKP
jgi:hypothetical protein